MTRRKGEMTRNHLKPASSRHVALETEKIRGPENAENMIGELNAAFGCDATLTFDKDAAKNGAFRHLPA
jgi:hypothetical protein